MNDYVSVMRFRPFAAKSSFVVLIFTAPEETCKKTQRYSLLHSKY